MSGEERRRFLRFDAIIDGEFTVPGEERSGVFMTGNVSRSGLKALLNRQVEAGKTVELELKRPDSIVPTFALGKVVWVRKSETEPGYDAGINLEQIDPLERQFLMEYCFKGWYKSKSNKELESPSL